MESLHLLCILDEVKIWQMLFMISIIRVGLAQAPLSACGRLLVGAGNYRLDMRTSALGKWTNTRTARRISGAK